MEATTINIEMVHKLSELAPYADGSIAKKVIAKKEGGDMILMAFKNGQELKEHTAPADALVQILEGKCKITISGKPFHLKAGEFIIMPANIPHAVASDGDFKMLLTRIKD